MAVKCFERFLEGVEFLNKKLRHLNQAADNISSWYCTLLAGLMVLTRMSGIGLDIIDGIIEISRLVTQTGLDILLRMGSRLFGNSSIGKFCLPETIVVSTEFVEGTILVIAAITVTGMVWELIRDRKADVGTDSHITFSFSDLTLPEKK